MSNLLRVKCECGKVFGSGDVRPPIMSMGEALGVSDSNFYGGNVTCFSKTTCDCKKRYLLYLRSVQGGYEVIDMELIKKGGKK